MKKNIAIFIKLLLWFFLIRNILYFSTYIPFNLLYILLLLGFKHTSLLWIIIIDILMVAFIINPHKTIHKITSFYQKIKFSLLQFYLIYLIFYSAINIITFEPFFYESLYISSRIPFLIVLVASLYLGFQNFTFNSFYNFIVDTKKSIYSLLGIKSKAELKEEEQRNKVLEYQRQDALRKKYKKLNNITIKQLDTRKQFEFEFFHEKYAPNTLLTVKRELNKRNKERIVGAAMFINAEQLQYNKKKIYNKQVHERSDESRKSANVPGYDFLAKRYNYTNRDNKKIFIWHRTHLIPFRYTLSEGDTIDNLLFAGTAHLNSGDRPDINYDVWSRSEEIDGRPQRKKDLRKKFTLNQPIESSDEGTFEKYYKLEIDHDITVPGAPEDTYYSLADVEEVVDEIIMDSPNSDFAYGTILEYENDLLLAPRWCTVVLINKTLNKLVFHIKLSNVK